MTKYALLVAVSVSLVGVAACTRPNAAVCCVSAADCSSIGVSDPARNCALGLTCQDHSCVEPSCTTSADCSGGTPVCTNGTCVACDAQNACPLGELCKIDDGTCVACLSSADCSAADPVCDMTSNTCRICALDSECASGACADDGTCVMQENVIYLDASGTDSGTCSRTSPCVGLQFAIGVATVSRNQIVLAPGTYQTPPNGVFVDVTGTSATALFIHGGNSTLANPGAAENVLYIFDVPVTVRDVVLSGGSPALQTGSAPVLVERIKIQNFLGVGIRPGSNLTIHDLDIETPANLRGINLLGGSNLTLDRAVIHGGLNAINTNGGTLDATNLLVFGTSDTAIILDSGTAFAQGTIRSSTIADSGIPSGSGTAGIVCAGGFNLQSTIVWTATSVRAPISAGCNLMNDIVGPAAVAGASNTDPKFVNATAHDYHLAAGSPAIDGAATGPATDFEADPRPQGLRFDIGADEAKQ